MGIFRKLFFDYEWVCAYRKCEPSETVIPNPLEKRLYHVISLPKRYWLADPFIYCHDGEYCAFFECFDKKKDKAYLCGKRLSPESDSLFKIYEFKGHSSYPHIFENGGNLFMIPETCAEKKIRILKCEKWPDLWIEDKIILENNLAVDSTTFLKDDKIYLMTFILDKIYSNHGELYIGLLPGESDNSLELQRVSNYIKNTGRPGGNCFNLEEEHIRVVQPGCNYYGEKIEFFKFSYDYETNYYKEEKIGEFLPSQVVLDKKIKFNGIHTFNRCGEIEIVDVRTVFTFDLFKPFKKIFKILGLFGYKNCDKKMEYIDEQ